MFNSKYTLLTSALLASSAPTLADEETNAWLSDKNGCKGFIHEIKPSDSLLWQGDCIDGYISGNGTAEIRRNGELLEIIQANFIQGRAEGIGVIEDISGSKFEGNFLAGERTGKGRLDSIYGWHYEGSFEKGKLAGKGTTLYIDGSSYVGDYANNLPSGKGIFKEENGNVYEGEYVNGKRHGHGRLTWSNGVIYDGRFLEGRIASDQYKTPIVLENAKPHYPKIMLRYGNEDKVKIKLHLDEFGRPDKLTTLESHHPTFEKAAIKAILNSKFKPAMLSDKPVPTETVIPYTFKHYPGSKGEDLPYSSKTLDTPQSTEKLDISEPIKYKVVAPVVYPLELYLKAVNGSATVTATVDPSGKPRNVKIKKSTHDAFGRATKAMIESSTFTPAYNKNKLPIWASFTFEQVFSKYNLDVESANTAFRLVNQLRSSTSGIHQLHELDKKPISMYAPPPVYPDEYQKINTQQSVLVEFYIDKQGEVQLPRIINADDQNLGWIALSTVSRWIFQPPTIQGKPVDAIVKMPVLFQVDTSSKDRTDDGKSTSSNVSS